MFVGYMNVYACRELDPAGVHEARYGMAYGAPRWEDVDIGHEA